MTNSIREERGALVWLEIYFHIYDLRDEVCFKKYIPSGTKTRYMRLEVFPSLFFASIIFKNFSTFFLEIWIIRENFKTKLPKMMKRNEPEFRKENWKIIFFRHTNYKIRKAKKELLSLIISNVNSITFKNRINIFFTTCNLTEIFLIWCMKSIQTSFALNTFAPGFLRTVKSKSIEIFKKRKKRNFYGKKEKKFGNFWSIIFLLKYQTSYSHTINIKFTHISKISRRSININTPLS